MFSDLSVRILCVGECVLRRRVTAEIKLLLVLDARRLHSLTNGAIIAGRSSAHRTTSVDPDLIDKRKAHLAIWRECVVVHQSWRCRRRCQRCEARASRLVRLLEHPVWTLLIASRRWACTHRFSLSLGLLASQATRGWRGEAIHATRCRASATLGSPIESSRRNVCDDAVEWNWKQAIQTLPAARALVALVANCPSRTRFLKWKFQLTSYVSGCFFIFEGHERLARIWKWDETRMNVTQHAILLHHRNSFELLFVEF